MIFTKPSTRVERMKICESCEFFNVKHKTCGTPRWVNPAGDLVEIEGRKRRVRLCGCDMRIKTKIKAASCPARFWTSVAKEGDYRKLRALVKEVKDKGSVQTAVAEEIVELYNSSFGAKKKLGMGCSHCLKEIIQEVMTTEKHR